MRAYVWTTGIVYVLVTSAHLWRIAAENPALIRDLPFMGITAVAAGMAGWAGWVLFTRAHGTPQRAGS